MMTTSYYSTYNNSLTASSRSTALLSQQRQPFRRFSTNDGTKKDDEVNGATVAESDSVSSENQTQVTAVSGELTAEISNEALIQVAKGKKPRQKKPKV